MEPLKTVTSADTVDCKEILIQLYKQGARMDIIETKLDTKFAQLVGTMDGRLEQLINILAGKANEGSKTFNWIVMISLLVIAVSMVGKDSVIEVINAIKH